MLIANVLFVAGTNQVGDRIVCYVTTALLHYFLLATWFWMTCNALNMYIMFVRVSIRVKNSVKILAVVYIYVHAHAISNQEPR